MKRKRISMFGAVVLAIGLITLSAPNPAIAVTCNSTKSGNWNDTTVWSCSAVPGSSDDVYIESGHTVTLTQDESVNDLHLNATTGQQRLVTGSFTLNVNGKMRAFTDPAPGTDTTTLPSSTTTPWIDTSGGGKISIVGNTRTVFNSGEWGANPPGWNLDISMNSGQIATASANVKAGTISVSSGIFNVSSAALRPDSGSTNTGTLTIADSATLTVNSFLSRTSGSNNSFASFTINGTGKFETSSTSTNVWPSGTTTSFSSTSTVEYSGASQVIQTATYGNLTLSGSGTKTSAVSTLTIKGSLAISAGAFSAPTQINIAGNWTNNGTFTAGTGTVTFNGTSEQTIGGSSATAFNNLTINSGATVVLPTDATATALTNNGTIKQTRDVTGNTDVTFMGIGGYGGVTINANNSGLGSTLVAISGNQACDTTDSTVHRCFDITPTTSTERNATVTFFFSSSELNSQTCSSLDAWRWTGSSWVSAGTSGTRQCSTEPYSLPVTGVTTFSPFALRSGSGPTAIVLSSLQATAHGSRPSLLLLTGPLCILALGVMASRLLAFRSHTN